MFTVRVIDSLRKSIAFAFFGSFFDAWNFACFKWEPTNRYQRIEILQDGVVVKVLPLE